MGINLVWLTIFVVASWTLKNIVSLSQETNGHSVHTGSICFLLKGFLSSSLVSRSQEPKPPTSTRPVPSLSDHAVACRGRYPPRVGMHMVNSPRGSLRKGCFILRLPHGPMSVRPAFCLVHCYWCILDKCDTDSIGTWSNSSDKSYHQYGWAQRFAGTPCGTRHSPILHLEICANINFTRSNVSNLSEDSCV